MFKTTACILCAVFFFGSCCKNEFVYPDVVGSYLITSVDSCTQVKPGSEFREWKHYDDVGGKITFNSDSTGFLELDSSFLCFDGDFTWSFLRDESIVFKFENYQQNALFSPHKKKKLDWIAIYFHCGDPDVAILVRRFIFFDLEIEQ